MSNELRPYPMALGRWRERKYGADVQGRIQDFIPGAARF